MQWFARRDRGASATEYGAVILLVAAVVAAVSVAGVPGRVAELCADAICRVTGGADCSGAQQAGSEEDAETRGLFPDPPPMPTPTTQPAPERSPIPKPGCADPDAAWAEGLHAHNDYDNEAPLQDALDQGAVSVEADIWPYEERGTGTGEQRFPQEYEDGELVLKHDEHGVPQGSLKETYADALRERAEENGGEIYPGRDEPFQLVVEIKGQESEEDKRRMYDQALRDLEGLPDDVNVVFSGGRPSDEYVLTNKPGNVSFDIAPEGGGCELPPKVDVDSPDYDPEYAENFTMFNAEWGKGHCGDQGNNKIDDREQAELDEIVDRAHRSGLKVRFWGAPDDQVRADSNGNFIPCHGQVAPGRQSCEGEARRDAWAAQQQAGVDFVNTNHLGNGERWIRSCGEET
ncbi:phosphatidylinositol-specific phospholipase C/glycerophosphodiester phosphodiesterase family protein [Nocardiopsis coralliicola]